MTDLEKWIENTARDCYPFRDVYGLEKLEAALREAFDLGQDMQAREDVEWINKRIPQSGFTRSNLVHVANEIRASRPGAFKDGDK